MNETSGDAATERWTLGCSPEQFAALAGDARFPLMLSFARASNALRFALATLTEGEEDGTPARVRQRMNAFMLLAGTVFEAVRLAQFAERELGALAAFEAGFRAILDDPGSLAYAEDVLGAVAAHAPFRFGPPSVTVPDAGGSNGSGEVRFGSGIGRAPGAFHYALADELLLRAALDLGETGVYEQLKEHMETTALLAERCAESADRLIAELLREQPWTLRR
jgi:hypothetical protein